VQLTSPICIIIYFSNERKLLSQQLFALFGRSRKSGKIVPKEQSKLENQLVVFLLKAFELNICFEGFGLDNFAKTIFWVQIYFPAIFLP
jgi:hypothetical protein